jgi:hypothetical protein
LFFGWKAFAHVTELGQDLCGVDASGTRERHDDPAVRQLRDGLFGARRQSGDREDEAFKNANQRADDLALASVSASLARPAGAARRRANRSAAERRPL